MTSASRARVEHLTAIAQTSPSLLLSRYFLERARKLQAGASPLSEGFWKRTCQKCSIWEIPGDTCTTRNARIRRKRVRIQRIRSRDENPPRSRMHAVQSRHCCKVCGFVSKQLFEKSHSEKLPAADPTHHGSDNNNIARKQSSSSTGVDEGTKKPKQKQKKKKTKAHQEALMRIREQEATSASSSSKYSLSSFLTNLNGRT